MTRAKDPAVLAAAVEAKANSVAAVDRYHRSIVAAHENEWSLREIAGKLGISTTRVHQIVRQPERQVSP